jgi:site-specific DNA-methyltransferase (adenine-specific)
MWPFQKIKMAVFDSLFHTIKSYKKGVLSLYRLDCMELMKHSPDKYFDVAIVDPPYGINAPNMLMGSNPKRSKNDGFNSGPSTSTAVRLKGRLNTGSGKLKNRLLNQSLFDWDNSTPPQEYFSELFRVSKNQIIWGGNYFPLPPTRCIICWDKMQPWENFSQWEMAWTSFDKPAKMYRISNTGGANKEKKIHPTQKPVALYAKIYEDFITKGMICLDTHLGSGSHAIVAEKVGIPLIATEINETTFLDMNERVIKETSMPLFDLIND